MHRCHSPDSRLDRGTPVEGTWHHNDDHDDDDDIAKGGGDGDDSDADGDDDDGDIGSQGWRPDITVFVSVVTDACNNHCPQFKPNKMTFSFHI